MPSLNQYEGRVANSVVPFATSGIRYGFLTNVNAATRTACGHAAVDMAALPSNIVFGANAPKPGRASKLVADEYNSSFYDFSKYAALKADGWRMTRPTIRRARSSPRSKAVYVTVGADGDGNGGVKYTWQMPDALYSKIGAARTALGIRDATSDDRNLVWGPSLPRPSRATKVEGTDTLSTFYDPSNALPTGWASTGSGGRESISADA